MKRRRSSWLRRGIELVQQLDPAGVGARDLRECLLIQIAAQQHEFAQLYARQAADAETEEDPHRSFRAEAEAQLEERRRSMEVAALIVDQHLPLLQKRDVKDLARAAQVTPEEAHAAIEFIRTLDPRPGRLYNREQTRLIEPDVVFIKRGGEWVVTMNEEDLPSLRLSRRYRQMLAAEGTDKEVKEYVKERFRSALQLMRNIAQRKSTILRTCEVIVRRQQDFLEKGIEALRPMMIKEVAEEIGVHPSTVSRAVANKYAHTPQGVIELRFFFSEGLERARGRGHAAAGAQAQGAQADRRRRCAPSAHRRPAGRDAAGAGHSTDPPHRGQVSRRHEHPHHAPAQAARRVKEQGTGNREQGIGTRSPEPWSWFQHRSGKCYRIQSPAA